MNIHVSESCKEERKRGSFGPPGTGSASTMKVQKEPRKIKVPDIKDFSTFEELSSRVMDDVDIINEIISKYDRRTTDHIMALTFSLYKERIIGEGLHRRPPIAAGPFEPIINP